MADAAPATTVQALAGHLECARAAIDPGTIGGALAAARQILAAADPGPTATPRLDAELLLAAALDVDRSRLVIDRDEPLPAIPAHRFWRLVERRAAHEPVAYLLGRREFRRLSLAVDPRVLIPRPETELLVEVGLTLAAGVSVLDVGTGSGAVALALKEERPDLTVAGIDLSADAVAVARSNAARLSVDVEFSVGDLLANMCSYGAVLANLPYVADRTALPADVADFEPAGALFGGPDGLDLVRRLVAQSRAPLLALEISPDQAVEVASLLALAGHRDIEILRDLADRDRVVVGRRG